MFLPLRKANRRPVSHVGILRLRKAETAEGAAIRSDCNPKSCGGIKENSSREMFAGLEVDLQPEEFKSGEGMKDRLYTLATGRVQAALRHIGDPDWHRRAIPTCPFLS